MFKALSLSDPGVKAARRHAAIIGKKLLGRGSFCAVFDSGKTVHKLTLDRYAYMMGTDQVIGCSGEHFTRVLYNHGEVGAVDERPLYLFECERLEKLPRSGELRALARRIAARTRKHKLYHMHNSPADSLALEELSVDEELPVSLQDAFVDLHSFVHRVDEGWSLDIHAANLMIRPSDGTLVLSDPLADVATRDHITTARWLRNRGR